MPIKSYLWKIYFIKNYLSVAVALSGRIGEIAEFPIEITYKGRLHGAQISVTFTVARLV